MRLAWWQWILIIGGLVVVADLATGGGPVSLDQACGHWERGDSQRH
jgi:hypothetical protein